MKFTLAFCLILIACAYSITLPRTGTDNDPSLVPSKLITQSYSGINYQMKMIYNSKGKFLTEEAAKMGVQPKDLAGVLKAESSGNGFASTGKMIIRFENHVFYRYYTNSGKDAAKVAIYNQHFKHNSSKTWTGHQFRSSANGTWQDFHGSQAKEWEVLQFAQNLDDTFALYSASYGVAQIMGFNYKALGHTNVQNMFIAFSGSIKDQLLGMFSFIKNNSKCYNALKSNPSDYVAFASCYNGSGQAEAYGKIINDAAQAYQVVTSSIGIVDDVIIIPTPTTSISKQNVVVFSTEINIRSQAGTAYTVVGKSSSGLEAIVVDGPVSANGYTWYKITTTTGVTGWAASENGWLQLRYPLASGASVKFNTSVKYRSAPGTSQTQLGTASSGQTATIVTAPSVANGYIWYGMTINGQTVFAPLGTNWYSKI